MTVGNELTRRGTLDGVGGAPYLLQAVRFVPTTANTRTYIQIVQEKSTLRRLISAAQTIQRQCYAQSDSLADVLHNAERLCKCMPSATSTTARIAWSIRLSTSVLLRSILRSPHL